MAPVLSKDSADIEVLIAPGTGFGGCLPAPSAARVTRETLLGLQGFLQARLGSRELARAECNLEGNASTPGLQGVGHLGPGWGCLLLGNLRKSFFELLELTIE